MFLFPFGEICYALSFFCFVSAIILAKFVKPLYCFVLCFIFWRNLLCQLVSKRIPWRRFYSFLWEYRFPTDDLSRPTTMSDWVLSDCVSVLEWVVGSAVGTGVLVSLVKAPLETASILLIFFVVLSLAFLCLFMFYGLILFFCSASLSRSLSGSVLQFAVIFPLKNVHRIDLTFGTKL